LQNSRGDLEIHTFPEPPNAVTTLVEETQINDRVIHQVLSDPRKVDQRGHIMEGKLRSWPNARQHQNLYTNVRLENAERRRLPTWGVWTAPALRNGINFIAEEPRRQNSPEDNFLPGFSPELGSITRGRKFDPRCPRLAASLVEDHLGDGGGDNDLKIWTLKHFGGQVGLLCGNSVPLRVYVGD
jgi:hypothetical protein